MTLPHSQQASDDGKDDDVDADDVEYDDNEHHGGNGNKNDAGYDLVTQHRSLRKEQNRIK